MARKNYDRKVREHKKDFSQTNKEGAIREMLATIKLMKEGYRVSLPIVDSRYDLIAEKYPNYIRIQVKNLKKDVQKDFKQPSSIDKWEIRAFSNPGRKKNLYDKKDADVIFAINKETEDFAIVPIEKIPSSGIVKISEKSDRKDFLNTFKALEEFKA
ncbi:Uncharacterised protein [uncultured archaeon]|nr:Uncharacterised protein [uncultured archaeon]